jgi:hypothetical protein
LFTQPVFIDLPNKYLKKATILRLARNYWHISHWT